MVQSQRIMVELAGMESTETGAVVHVGDRDDASSVTGSGAEIGEASARGAQAPAPQVAVSAALGELLVVVSGRTADTWWPALDVRCGCVLRVEPVFYGVSAPTSVVGGRVCVDH